jgi:chaperonin GroEL
MEDALNATKSGCGRRNHRRRRFCLYLRGEGSRKPLPIRWKAMRRPARRLSMKALESPLYYIVVNAGLDRASVIVNKVRNPRSAWALMPTEEYVDMVKAGILDPAKVTDPHFRTQRSVAARC